MALAIVPIYQKLRITNNNNDKYTVLNNNYNYSVAVKL